ncbi:MAG TPA: signal peptidase I [Wenzhouxiangella sp.]
MNYSLILTGLMVASGLLWIAYFIWVKLDETAHNKSPARWLATFGSLFPVLFIVVTVRSFVFEPFKIPSGSMMPTLLIGDFIVVNKFSYGLRLPVGNAKILETGEPQRGDVMVFRYPKDPNVNYIKRVVGLPGDEVTYRNKLVFINGEPMTQEQLGMWIGEGRNRNPPGRRPQLFGENLDGVEHQIVIYPDSPARQTQTWTVPEGHYFVLGDNRDQSLDSRAWDFVPEDHLVGKATRIWMHWDCSIGCVGWDRIGKAIE